MNTNIPLLALLSLYGAGACLISIISRRWDIQQVSMVIPILRLVGKPIVFYCHFPDQLLVGALLLGRDFLAPD